MTGPSLHDACHNLMAAADIVMVSTVDDQGWPCIRAMSNLRNRVQFPRLIGLFEDHRDDFLMYLTTNRLSNKLEQIGHDSRAGLCFCDVSGLHGLFLGGRMEVVDDPGIRRMIWHEEWIYNGGLDGDDYTVLRVLPEFANGWYRDHRFEFRIQP